MDKRSTGYAEEVITPQELIEEIYPLMGDYFEGEQELKEGKLIFRFQNGQSFIVTVAQC